MRVGGHRAEGAGVLDLDQVQRHRGTGRLVRRELAGEVVAGEHVAVEDDDRVVRPAEQGVGRMADRPAGAERLGLVHVDELEAQVGAVAQRGEDLGPVGRGEHDASHPGRLRPSELVKHERHAGHRQHRLGAAQRQRPQPGPQPADEQDRLDSVHDAGA